MGTNTGTIMTLANSIIGVSVLAMPFCFKQCGIVLSILMLIGSSLLSRLACHFLLKSAVMARRRTFEFLAFHTFGVTGKFTVELFIIGFLMGTCIAFFVVMGDLGPAIVAKVIGVTNSTALRPSVLIGLAVFVVLPLGMLRNVDSLSSVSMATIGFYSCLVLKVVVEALPHLLAGDWYEHVHFWRPAGIMQCIPIFSMALFCQTQLFEIYESMHNASLDRMNFVIRAACNICTGVYICVGFFGYIAFCTQSFTGNILMSFTPSTLSEMIKLGFVLSVAVSFPLVIFPCRASLYSLLFRRVTMPHHEGVGSHIPEARFKCLTIFIICVALVIGLLIPNIELVLGLVGSTIGVLICVMFPAAAFICMSTKSSTDRLVAQILLFIGALILVLGTYATLESASVKPEVPNEISVPVVNVDSLPHFNDKVDKSAVDEPLKLEEKKPALPEAVIVGDALKEKNAAIPVDLSPPEKREPDVKADASKADARQEPPVPVEPAAVVQEVVSAPSPPNEAEKAVKEKVKELAAEESKPKEPPEPEKKDEKLLAAETVDQDAIKKEDEELAEAEKGKKQSVDSKNDEILRKLEKHEEQQMKILEEQKQILQALQEHQEREVRERKMEQPPPQQEQQPVRQLPVQQPVQPEQTNQPIQPLPAQQPENVNHKKHNEQQLQPLPVQQQSQQILEQQQQQQQVLEHQQQQQEVREQEQQQQQQQQGQQQQQQQQSDNLLQNDKNTVSAGKAKEIKSPLLQIPDKAIARNVPDSAANEVEKPLRQKADLLQQIANGELKKPALPNRPLSMKAVQEKNIEEPLPKPSPSSDGLPEKPQHLADSDFQPKIKVPAMPVQTVLLERMRGQPNPGAPINKGAVQPPVSPASQAKSEERIDEIKAVRREILQEQMASTLNDPNPAALANGPALSSSLNQLKAQPHEREKRDIEEDTGRVSSDPLDKQTVGESVGTILENVADPKEQNCQIIDQAANEMQIQNEALAGSKMISDVIEVSARNKVADTVISDREINDIKEHRSMVNVHEVMLPTSASDTIILNEKPKVTELHQAISSDSSKNFAKISQIPSAVSPLIPVSDDPERIINGDTQKNEDSLIKATAHLSNPKIESNHDKIEILKQEGLSVGSEIKPMKRDLKSIQTSEEKAENSRKQE